MSAAMCTYNARCCYNYTGAMVESLCSVTLTRGWLSIHPVICLALVIWLTAISSRPHHEGQGLASSNISHWI